MKNYHEPSALITQEQIKLLEDIFEKIWSEETAFPGNWTPSNPAFGQCAVTSLIINDIYGGEFAYDKPNDHIWNILPDGTQQDFSREQAKDGTVFCITKLKTRAQILESEGAHKALTPQRYATLKKQFDKLYTAFSLQ